MSGSTSATAVSVLLLRGEDTAGGGGGGELATRDAYEEALGQLRWAVTTLPVLGFERNQRGLDGLVAALPNDARPPAIIATSPRAVWAVLALREGGGACTSGGTAAQRAFEALLKCPWYVVGAATARAACDMGVAEVRRRGSGSAEALVAACKEEWSSISAAGKSFIFLCGDLRRSTVPAALDAMKAKWLEAVVYCTVPRPPTAESLTRAAEAGHTAIICFFSPSGVSEPVVEWIKSRPSHQPTLVAAIGPTSASAAREAGLQVHCVAAKPDAPHLVAACVDAVALANAPSVS